MGHRAAWFVIGVVLGYSAGFRDRELIVIRDVKEVPMRIVETRYVERVVDPLQMERTLARREETIRALLEGQRLWGRTQLAVRRYREIVGEKTVHEVEPWHCLVVEGDFRR